MSPRMTEVFVVREASVQSLAQRYKIPLRFAQAVNDESPACADILIQLFLWAFETEREGWKGENGEDAMEMAFHGFMDGAGLAIIRLLKRFPAKKTELLALPGENIGRWPLNRMDAVVDLSAQLLPAADLSKQAVVKLPDGSYWVKIEGDECRREGDVMQHCGTTSPGNEMYSLRDTNHKSHVTCEFDADTAWRDQEQKGAALVQAKGKQNDAPQKKYWPAILQLCKKLKARPDHDMLVTNTEDPLFDWLDDELAGDRMAAQAASQGDEP